VRLAEAACGSKWTAETPAGAKFAEMKERFPELAPTFDELGIDASMDSKALKKHLCDKLICDKKAAKKVLAAVGDGDMEKAAATLEGKVCITL